MKHMPQGYTKKKRVDGVRHTSPFSRFLRPPAPRPVDAFAALVLIYRLFLAGGDGTAGKEKEAYSHTSPSPSPSTPSHSSTPLEVSMCLTRSTTKSHFFSLCSRFATLRTEPRRQSDTDGDPHSRTSLRPPLPTPRGEIICPRGRSADGVDVVVVVVVDHVAVSRQQTSSWCCCLLL